MHTVKFKEPRSFGEIQFASGVRYLVEDHNAAQFMVQGGAQVDYVEAPADLDPTQDWNGARLLIARCGALGDLLMLTPTIRRLKELWPTLSITIACFPRYQQVFQGNPHVSGCIDYPVLDSALSEFDRIVWLEDAIEAHPDARTMPIIDALAKRFGVTLTDRQTDWFWMEGEKEAALERFPRTPKKKRLGVQVRASAEYKSPPAPVINAALMALHKRGWEIFMFGGPGEVNMDDTPGVVNLTALKTTVRESAAIANTCDVILSPDSFLVHLAGAISKPCVALYGPFPYKLYTAHYPLCFALTGKGCDIAPCHHHPRATLFHPDGPCYSSGRCEMLASIDPKRIVAKVEQLGVLA